MSREHVVMFVTPDETGEIDGQPAEVFMRFTEEPDADFLQRLAKSRPGRRVYCLMGASTWYEVETYVSPLDAFLKFAERNGFRDDLDPQLIAAARKYCDETYEWVGDDQ